MSSKEFGPVIRSRTNARVKALRASFGGKASQPGDLLGLEGEHLLHEAHRSGLSFETVFLREGSEASLHRHNWEDLRTENWILLSHDVFDSAVSTATPQGIAATWRIQEPPCCKPLSTILVLENLQDPGNLGTLIRTTEAFGGTQVMVTPHSASPWNPKALRSSAGSVFRTPVVRKPLGEIAAELRSQGVRIFAAVAGFVGEHIFSAPNGAVWGKRQNTTAEYSKDAADGTRIGLDTGYVASLAYDADFIQPCAIMIGNEGAGLSTEALGLADEQVLIPCSVESLNAAVAGSVLLYEVMRQIPLRGWARKQGFRP